MVNSSSVLLVVELALRMHGLFTHQKVLYGVVKWINGESIMHSHSLDQLLFRVQLHMTKTITIMWERALTLVLTTPNEYW